MTSLELQKELADAMHLIGLSAKALEHAGKKVVAVQKEINKPKIKLVKDESKEEN